MRKIVYSNDMHEAMRPCVATIGFFDGVHRGHQFLVGQLTQLARQEGLESTVITFDKHPREVVNDGYVPELLNSLEEKMIRLSLTDADNCVILPFDEQMAALSAREFMETILVNKLNVRKLLIGYDNRFGHDRTEGFADYVRYGHELGVEVTQWEPLLMDGAGVSSSAVRRLVSKGDVEGAEKLLGYPYTLVGTVVEGFQKGRQLGFPTANLQLMCAHKLLPAPGVYAVRVRVEHSMEMKRGIMNIGTRPTFNGHSLALEVHILDYEADLYGERLMVTFVKRLREERKFDDIGQLVRQMHEDVRQVKEYLPLPPPNEGR